MMSLSRLFYQQMRREWRIQMRQKKSWINALIFFGMVMVFFPLTLPADARLQSVVAPGVVWIAVLLSNLLAAERLFQSDHDEGVLELWVVSGQPLSIWVLAKLLVHWGLNLVPLLLLSPIIAILFHLSVDACLVLDLSFIVGTPAIVLLSAFAVAFGTSLQQKGVLMGLILLPLAVPIIILGAATTTAEMVGWPVQGYVACLLGLSCLLLALLSQGIAAVLRSSFG